MCIGDFNLAPDDGALAPMKDGMADTCRAVHTPGSPEGEAVGTIPGDQSRIDQIWLAADGFHIWEAGLLPPPPLEGDPIDFYVDVDLRR